VLDPARDRDAATLIERYTPDPKDRPLAVCPRGTILKNPSERDLAQALGMVPIDAPDRTYDVVIIGAGPAGLSTAVYAASEGLSVIVLDAVAFGGQAGESARIENYLGFPTGIPGRELTARAFVQAQKFGAEMVIPAEASASIARKCHMGFNSLTAGGSKAPRWLWPRAPAIGGLTFLAYGSSRDAACGTGPRPSKRACAGTRRLPLWAAATLPGKRRCF
jgi:hypothetical protein